MEYLIGLIATLLGAANLEPLKQYVRNDLSYLLISIITIHVILLTLVYSFRRGTHTEIRQVSYIETLSKGTLLLSTFVVFMFLLSTLFATGLNLLPEAVRAKFQMAVFGVTVSPPAIAGLILPGVLSLVMAGVLWKEVWGKITASRNIDIHVVPDQLRIRSTFRDSSPLNITLVNNWSQNISVDVEIHFPRDVEWRQPGEAETHTSDFQESYEIGSERQEPIDLEFKSPVETEERRAGTATIEVTHDYGRSEHQVEMLFDTY